VGWAVHTTMEKDLISRSSIVVVTTSMSPEEALPGNSKPCVKKGKS